MATYFDRFHGFVDQLDTTLTPCGLRRTVPGLWAGSMPGSLAIFSQKRQRKKSGTFPLRNSPNQTPTELAISNPFLKMAFEHV